MLLPAGIGLKAGVKVVVTTAKIDVPTSKASPTTPSSSAAKLGPALIKKAVVSTEAAQPTSQPVVSQPVVQAVVEAVAKSVAKTAPTETTAGEQVFSFKPGQESSSTKESAAGDTEPRAGTNAQATAEATLQTAAALFSGLGRNGYDDKGGTPEIEILPFAEGAEASGDSIRFGRINGDSTVDNLDIVTHEYTHLVIVAETDDREDVHHYARRAHDLRERSEQHLTNGGHQWDSLYLSMQADIRRYERLQDEFRAVHEGVADVFGAAVEQDWNIGDTRNPDTGEAVATTRDELANGIDGAGVAGNSSNDPHFASGIISNAAADVQEQLGWEAMSAIFYGAISDERFAQGATFEDIARTAIDAARRIYGDSAAADVQAAFAGNGVDVRLAQAPAPRAQPS